METIFDDAPLNEQIRQIEAEIELDSFWDNNPNAQSIFQQLNQLKRKRDNIQSIKAAIDNAETGLSLLEEDPNDEDMVSEITTIISDLSRTIDQIEIEYLSPMNGITLIASSLLMLVPVERMPKIGQKCYYVCTHAGLPKKNLLMSLLR